MSGKILVVLGLSVIFFLVHVTNGYNILVVFPMPAKSHFHLGNALARGLVATGHNITMVGFFEEKNPPPGGIYTDVLLNGMEKAIKSNINFFDLEHVSPALGIYISHQMGNSLTKKMFEHENFKKLLASKQKFDAVIIEQFCNDAMKVLGWYYDAPVIIFSTVGLNYWVAPLVGNPFPIAYVPDIHLGFTENMTFIQRFKNLGMAIIQRINHLLFYFPVQREVLRQNFPGSPNLEELMTNVSLVLLNSHESSSQALPLVPNMISVGGMHITPGNGLPKDLKNIMDHATEGIVYFSMGSNLSPSQIKEDIARSIFDALGKLPNKVFIKWHKDVPEKSNNILIRQWFPQKDILAHPNVKLFITHGGLLSTLESIHHGVPVLMLPIFGDQKMNAAKATAGGYGLSMTFSKITEESLTKTLNELLNNKQYSENVKWRSALMSDRIVKPMDTALYWIEYVIRHKGAPHLRVAGINMSFYKYFLLDILAIVVIGISALSIVVYVTCRKCCCSKKQKKSKIQ